MSPLNPRRRLLADVLDLAQLGGDAVVAVALTAITALQPAAAGREPEAGSRGDAVTSSVPLLPGSRGYRDGSSFGAPVPVLPSRARRDGTTRWQTWA